MRHILSLLAAAALAGCSASGGRFSLPGLDAGFRDLGTGIAWVGRTASRDRTDLGSGLGRFGTQVGEDARRTGRNVAGAPAWVAGQAARDAHDFDRGMDLVLEDVAGEFGYGRALVAGAPRFVAREVREGTGGIASTLRGEASRASRDLRSIPGQARRILEMGLR